MRGSVASALVACFLVAACILVAGCDSTVPPPPSQSSLPTPDQSAAATASLVASAEPTLAATASPTPSPTPISPAHTVTSDDGLLTIDVPEGALPVGLGLTALAQGEEDLPPELSGLSVRSAFYRLEPDGTVFASPVIITRRVALRDLGLDLDEDGLPILALAMRSEGGTWEWLDGQQLTLDGDFVVVSGSATHTSHVFAFGGTTFTRFSFDPEASLPLGGLLTLTATLLVADGADDPPTLGTAFAPIVASDNVALGLSSAPADGSLSQGFRCLRDGISFVGVRYSVLNVGAESVLFAQLGLCPVSTEVTFGTALTCEAATAPETSPPSPNPAASSPPPATPSPSAPL